MQAHIGLLQFVTEMKLFILIVLVLNMFLKKLKNLLGKDIKANFFRVQANNSVMCRYFCTGFIDFMLAGKKLTDFTNTFSPHDFKKNGDVILSYLKMDESNSIETIDNRNYAVKNILNMLLLLITQTRF